MTEASFCHSNSGQPGDRAGTRRGAWRRLAAGACLTVLIVVAGGPPHEALAQEKAGASAASTYKPPKAVRFKLRNNPYLELCQKLQAALDRRPSYPPGFCADDVPLPLDDPDFRRPSWEELDPLEHRDLVERLFWRHFDRKGDKTEAERAAIWNGPKISRYEPDPIPGLPPVDILRNEGILENMPYTVLRYAPRNVSNNNQANKGIRR